ncbi:MAG TPA: hypothetical protein VIW19_07955, partial [Gaiellaceae bacterium]
MGGALAALVASSAGGADSVVYGSPNVQITKVADAGSVNYGQPVGYTVTLSNTGGADAHGLAVTDALPGGQGIDWSIDAGGSDPGWSVDGSPPNETLAYSQTTLAGGATTHAHVISGTTEFTCGLTLDNTASFTTSDDGSGQASASVAVGAGAATAFAESFDGVTPPALPAGWTAANAAGPDPLWVTS